ncbi:MAG: T9SS type A sorting domain-containing protein [Saprospiraceae bacterium]|nr:T9SS type A sorting domain-containing protein [Candidatus Brachybacter algidus]MBK8749070.1 T9SS type A sorting domain-containing protein [Candidatus Brachybacter algidus]
MKLLQSVVKDEVILVQDAGYKEVIHVTIYDMSGRELKKLVKISQQKIIIDLENEFVPGMYILNVRTKKEHFAFKFLIIK